MADIIYNTKFRLNDEITEFLNDSIDAKASIPALGNQLSNKLGVQISTKKIHNHIRKLPQTEFSDVARSLEDSGEVNYLLDEKNNMKGVVYQDKFMKGTFKFYNSILLVDSTHGISSNGFSFFSVVTIDGDNNTVPVFWMFLYAESKLLLEHGFKIFKQNNPEHVNLQIVFTDKDLSERSAITSVFPGVKLRLCRFHVLRSFGREVTVSNYNITTQEKKAYCKTFQKMVYAKSRAELNLLIEKIRNKDVKEYILKNWMPIADEWNLFITNNLFLHGTSTTNRVERYFGKLKKICLLKKPFHIALNELMKFQKYDLNLISGKYRTCLFKVHTIEETPISHLFNFVTLSVYKKIIYQFKKTQTTFFEESQDKYQTNSSYCTCGYTDREGIPCSHLLELNNYQDLEQYFHLYNTRSHFSCYVDSIGEILWPTSGQSQAKSPL